MKILVKDIEVLIDVIELDIIRDYTWRWTKDNFLQGSSGKYRGKLLHRVIAERMGLNPDKRVFRKNNNCLDFRRPNLIDFSPLQESIRKNALIDGVDMDLIRDYNWSFDSDGYLQAWVNGRIQLLHSIIAARMGFDPSKLTDHIDRNKENNHRSNLREATHQQNKVNSKKYKNNTSGYTGVYKVKNRWRVIISVNYKPIHLGYFDDIIEAARAYDKAALKYFGEFAATNFPRSDYSDLSSEAS